MLKLTASQNINTAGGRCQEQCRKEKQGGWLAHSSLMVPERDKEGNWKITDSFKELRVFKISTGRVIFKIAHSFDVHEIIAVDFGRAFKFFELRLRYDQKDVCGDALLSISELVDMKWDQADRNQRKIMKHEDFLHSIIDQIIDSKKTMGKSKHAQKIREQIRTHLKEMQAAN
ncbi:hypothetical protein KJ969_04480 [Patescibacteria group bacterium]|nr:hypothetical protein [Patescibacteria group bacterium]